MASAQRSVRRFISERSFGRAGLIIRFKKLFYFNKIYKFASVKMGD
ncbi:hypothetical protein ZPR_0264 [Zunongwangia profunda SM-A87]|uniref:Uncharacterized protein n=1 Tax=Zunongwangia profunda (strain DSM 18752 / CCTCC AB 206139 / SM-A87) TaxID=655815 RepID=D5BCW3_ZUNPS|nr:hypothetical protein ZPR_0264 [Zunongwangia profunda SM-A87]